MNPIYEKLFAVYGEPTLRNTENFDSYALRKTLDRFPLTDDQRRELIDFLFDHYYQWSLDAFTMASTTAGASGWVTSPMPSRKTYGSIRYLRNTCFNLYIIKTRQINSSL